MKKAITFITHFIASCWVFVIIAAITVLALDVIGLIEFEYYWRFWQLIWQGAVLVLVAVIINAKWGAK